MGIADARRIVGDEFPDKTPGGLYEASGERQKAFIAEKRYIDRLYDMYDPNHKLSPAALLVLKDFEEFRTWIDSVSKPGFYMDNALAYWRGALADAQGRFTDPEHATLVQMRAFLAVHKRGGQYIWDKANDKDGQKFRKKYFYWFPDTIANAIEPYDTMFMGTIVHGSPFEGEAGKFFGIRRTSTMGELHRILNDLTDQMSGMQNAWVASKEKEFDVLDAIAIKDASHKDVIFEYAVALRERDNDIGNAKVYLDEYNRAKAEYDKIKDTTYVYNGEQITADRAVEVINQRLTARLQRVYETWMDGRFMDKDGNWRTGEELLVMVKATEGSNYQPIDVMATMANIAEITRFGDRENTPVVGVNVVRRIVHDLHVRRIAEQVTLSTGIKKGDQNYTKELRKNMNEVDLAMRKKSLHPERVGQYNYAKYFPHLDHPNVIVEKYARDRAYKELKEATKREPTAKEIQDFIAYTQHVAQSDPYMIDLFDSIMADRLDMLDPNMLGPDGKLSIDKITDTIAKTKLSSNMLSRDKDNTLPFWAKDIRALDKYEKQIISAYYRSMMSLMGDMQINKFIDTNNNFDPVEKNKWVTFMKIYLRDNLGMPTSFSSADVRNLPELQSGLYWNLTDEYAAEKMAKFAGKLFPERGEHGKSAEREQMVRLYSGKLANFSAMEAKYQLMTLLSRPKNWVNNIVGGDPNTIISAGFSNWMKTFQIGYLKNYINPQWTSINDAYKWAESHGALESFLSNELSLAYRTSPANVKKGLDALVNFIKKEPNADNRTLLEVWKKEGLTESAFNKFAFFMKSSERQLRYRSFMAHYIKARQVLELGGAIIDPNDPVLIAMAQKGVSATQFVYNNANRPAFSRTSLGKILSRFQLWAWNSTRFRTQITRDMLDHGIDTGSDAADRFQRMVISDMFMIGMAAMLPFSVFEASLPQPWGWMKDTAEWLFGDEDEREKAFMGGLPGVIAPLQVGLPPSARAISPLIGSLYSGDWERYFSYHIWTYFPYGLMGRDIWRSVKKPINAPGALVGFPLTQLEQMSAKLQKKESQGWNPAFRLVDPVEVEQ